MQLAKTFKQFMLVTGMTALALMLFNAMGADIAFAQAITDSDQPNNIRLLSGGKTDIRGIALVIVDFFLGFLGLLAVVMIIYGGFLYVGSGGNPENVDKAKKILMYAAIGIIIIIISFALVNTIFGAATTAA